MMHASDMCPTSAQLRLSNKQGLSHVPDQRVWYVYGVLSLLKQQHGSFVQKSLS